MLKNKIYHYSGYDFTTRKSQDNEESGWIQVKNTKKTQYLFFKQ